MAHIAFGHAEKSTGAGEPRRDAVVPVRLSFACAMARWAALAVRAVAEAGLPADAAFRSALNSYLEWSSRVTDAPVPSWDWGPGGRQPVEPRLVYSAGTIDGAARRAARSSLRNRTARRIFAIMLRKARVTGFGRRKCEANSLLISSGRQ